MNYLKTISIKLSRYKTHFLIRNRARLLKRMVFLKYFERKGYQLTNVFVEGRVYQLSKGSDKFVFKLTTKKGILVVRDLFPEFQKQCSTIVFPEYIDGGYRIDLGYWIMMSSIDGDSYSELWKVDDDELVGGKAIPITTVSQVLDIISEFKNLNIKDVKNIHNLIDNGQMLKYKVYIYLGIIMQDDLLTTEECDKAKNLIDIFVNNLKQDDLMLSNRDFQFRNFIALPEDRIGIIDWDTARISSFELEHCLVNQWLLMWNAAKWRQQFVKEAQKRFDLNIDKLRAAMLLRALALVSKTWRSDSSLRDIQVKHIKMTLDKNEFEKTWNGL